MLHNVVEFGTVYLKSQIYDVIHSNLVLHLQVHKNVTAYHMT